MSPILAQLELAHPAMLLALVIVPALMYVSRRGIRKTAGWQPTSSLIGRLFIVLLLILASAGLSYRAATSQRMVVFVVDRSASVNDNAQRTAEAFVRDAAIHRSHHRTTYLEFGAEPGLLDSTVLAPSTKIDSQGSNPADAVLLAAASIPPGFVPDIVLLTDGNQTRGELARAALSAHVPISVVPINAFDGSEVCVAEVNTPPAAQPFQPMRVNVTVAASQDADATVELVRDNELVESRSVQLTRGENWISFRTSLPAADRSVFVAKLKSAADTILENNARTSIVFTDALPRVLLVDSEPALAAPLAGALRSRGYDVAVQSPAEMLKTPNTLLGFDLLILSDISANELPAAKLDAIHNFVHDQGGGLIVLGGDKAFGRETFQASAIERMLPVEAAETVVARTANLAMVLVIDNSASMLEERRLELAKQAASRVVGLLSPHDKLGVLAFGSDTQWISDIVPAADKTELLGRIASLQAAGQTNMYPALQKAYLALEQTDADRRYVILLTDGVSSPGDFDAVAARMAAANIKVSTVSISQGADQTILQEIARIAGGQHRHCDKPEDLANIVVEAAETAAAEVGTPEFRPLVLRSLPGLQVATAPPLSGFVATSPKPQAELLLVGGEGDPLLAWWRYGAGVTVAFTSDAKNRWAQRWQTWPGYADFWARLARHAARTAEPRDYSIRVTRNGRRAEVTLDMIQPDGEFANGIEASLQLTQAGGRQQEIPMLQVAPGRYAATFEVAQLGVNELIVAWTDASGERYEQRRALAVDYSDELLVRPTNEELLRTVASVSGGKYNPQPAEVFAPDQRTADRVTPLWSYFVLAALLLWVVDVGLRRLRLTALGSYRSAGDLSREPMGVANRDSRLASKSTEYSAPSTRS